MSMDWPGPCSQELLGALSFQHPDVVNRLVGPCPNLVAKALILTLDLLNALWGRIGNWGAGVGE